MWSWTLYISIELQLVLVTKVLLSVCLTTLTKISMQVMRYRILPAGLEEMERSFVAGFMTSLSGQLSCSEVFAGERAETVKGVPGDHREG
ncbi:hypothetical protein LZ554_000368 [Drepanopeziza brunnea f. sp. 'monogermtubi']|nr:hypothetical protein LZ554_000368 [Drepanopeziza brunnea f. sp. 'monogermtubi']